MFFLYTLGHSLFRAADVVLCPTSPLFEEKGGATFKALTVDLVNPPLLDQAGLISHSHHHDGPTYSRKVDGTNRANQRLEGNETDMGRVSLICSTR